MKTAIIYWEIPDAIYYYVIDGDLTRFSEVFINEAVESEEEKQLRRELGAVFYNEEDGSSLQKDVTLEEFAEAISQGASVIRCGFFL